MRIYALVKKGTWTVFLPKIGPFDGHTLEEAEQAVRVAGGEVEGEDPIKVVILP